MVVNRIRADVQLSVTQVQEALGMPVAQVIPPAPEVSFQAATRNLPMIQVQIGGMLSMQYSRLAESIAERINRMISADQYSADINRPGSLVKEARHLVAFTGAGMSTPSGIPDFRSKGTGMWERYRPDGSRLADHLPHQPKTLLGLETPDCCARSGSAQPNPAHLALAQLGNSRPARRP